MASSVSIRHTVSGEMASTTWRSTTSRANSTQLHFDNGTPVVAGNSQASAFTSAITRGGKTPRSSRSFPVRQALHAFLEEPLTPLDHRVQGDPQILSDIRVVHPGRRGQHDPGPLNHARLS